MQHAPMVIGHLLDVDDNNMSIFKGVPYAQHLYVIFKILFTEDFRVLKQCHLPKLALSSLASDFLLIIMLYACRLLQNYEASENSMILKTIYDHYLQSTEGAKALSAARFAVLLNKVFDLKKTVIHINSVKNYRYSGIDLVQSSDSENVKPFPTSDAEITSFSSNYGYQCRRKGDSLILYSITSLECNGLSVLKEVHLQQDSVTVKVGRQILIDNMLPKQCKTWNELRFILYYVTKASVCVGYTINSGEGENWTLEDGRNIISRRSSQCLGVKGPTKDCCSKCVPLKKKSQQNTPLYHLLEHSYATTTTHTKFVAEENHLNIEVEQERKEENREKEQEDMDTSEELACNEEVVGHSEESDSEDGNRLSDPDFSPSAKRKPPKAPKSNITDIEELISKLPPNLKTNEAFVALLRSQVLNSEKEKHQRRWDTRF
jgi:hypothetical protein